MIRLVLACLVAACANAADFAADAAAVRATAETELAARRSAILHERSELSARLQQAAAKAQAARAARSAAEDAWRTLEAAAPEREAAAARNVAELEALERRLRDAPPRLQRLLRPSTTDQPVVDRAGVSRTVPVLSAGPRQVALGPDPATRGALVDGRVSGAAPPPVPAGMIALDITGQLASAQPHGHGVAGWIAAGRMFIWPILAVGLLGLAIAVVRLRALLSSRPDRTLAGAVLSHARDGRLDEARARLAATGDLANVLKAGLERLVDPRPAREAAVEAALIAAEPRLGRGLGLLALLAGIAPLLGLLGTVTGMIDLFAVIASQGAGQSRGLSGGISEALITTQAGMLVAVPLLVFHAILARLAERQRLVLEEAGAAVLGIEAGP